MNLDHHVGIDENDRLADEMVELLGVAEQVGIENRLQFLIAEWCRDFSGRNNGSEPLQFDLNLWLDSTGIPADLEQWKKSKARLAYLERADPKTDLGITDRERRTEVAKLFSEVEKIIAGLQQKIPSEPTKERAKRPETVELLSKMVEYQARFHRPMSWATFEREAPRVYARHDQSLPAKKQLQRKYRDLSEELAGRP
jgi:hypothetical protein